MQAYYYYFCLKISNVIYLFEFLPLGRWVAKEFLSWVGFIYRKDAGSPRNFFLGWVLTAKMLGR
jgi:hypothetical protein